MTRSNRGLGDGDVCPVNPAHEHMLTIKGSNPPKQYCPDASHDGRPRSSPRGYAPASRKFWPLQYGAFEQAVADWRAGQKQAAEVVAMEKRTGQQITGVIIHPQTSQDVVDSFVEGVELHRNQPIPADDEEGFTIDLSALMEV